MRQLRDDTHLILDGEVCVYRRERSKRWQAAFVIDGHTIRIASVGDSVFGTQCLGHSVRAKALGGIPQTKCISLCFSGIECSCHLENQG